MLKTGSLSLRFGPMYSCKSTVLNNELTIAADMGYSVLKINHSDDIRITGQNDKKGTTHNSSYSGLSDKIDYISCSTLSSLSKLDQYQVIGIDEATFFPDLYDYVKDLVEN